MRENSDFSSQWQALHGFGRRAAEGVDGAM
jgi:hypothetical protein